MSNKVPVFDNQPNPINVAALEDSEIWVINPNALRKLIDKFLELCCAVLINRANNLSF
jgi:CRP-like cAMP-binding protein